MDQASRSELFLEFDYTPSLDIETTGWEVSAEPWFIGFDRIRCIGEAEACLSV
jgi:hypothetical protein